MAFFLCSCGETFRPIATIVPPTTTPTPQAGKTAVVITDNGALAPPNNVSTARHFNLSGNTETGSSSVGNGPDFAVFAGNVGRIYVANAAEDTLTFYSVVAPSVGFNTVTLPGGSNPGWIEANVALASLYVSYQGRDSVGVISETSNAQTAEITLPGGAQPGAMVSTASKIFVAERGLGKVAVVDPVSSAVSATIDFGGGCGTPSALAIKPDGSIVYVVCKSTNNVYLINTANNSYTEVPPISVGPTPSSAVYDVKRNRVIVTNSGGNTVSVINEDTTAPATLHTVTNVAVGPNPVSATALADGTKIYVADQGSSDLTVIDSATLTVKTTIALAGPPQQVASSTDSLRVAVTVTGGSPNLTSVDATTDAINTTFQLTADPVYMVLLAQ